MGLRNYDPASADEHYGNRLLGCLDPVDRTLHILDYLGLGFSYDLPVEFLGAGRINPGIVLDFNVARSYRNVGVCHRVAAPRDPLCHDVVPYTVGPYGDITVMLSDDG